MRPLRRFGYFLLLAASCFAPPLQAQKIAVIAEHLYTMNGGRPGGPGMVLISGGKIEAVNPGANAQAPAGYQVFRAAYVTPGLIDTDSTVGISGAYNIPHDQDEDETTDPNTADVRSLDSFNPD